MTFSPEGWVSVKGLHQHFLSSITFWASGLLSDEDYDVAKQRGLTTAWECLESMKSVAILSPSDKVIPISEKVLQSGGYIHQKSNGDIHLDYGTLGSGHGGQLDHDGDYDKPMTEALTKLHY
jgi:hypothetical protein